MQNAECGIKIPKSAIRNPHSEEFMHFDLIVIGMGLSGLMAAKTAAEAGQKTLIIGKGMGSLSLFSNSIDVLGNLPKAMKMEPHKQAPDVDTKARRGEHPVSEGQFTHGQGSGSLGTGMSDGLSQWIKIVQNILIRKWGWIELRKPSLHLLPCFRLLTLFKRLAMGTV